MTGWGSGYEGILPLAFSLACEGYKIILVSLPGYGNSKNPSPGFYRSYFLFYNYAQVIVALLRRLGVEEAYFVGHSMGAEILAWAAAEWSDVCRKLVLLHPSGLWSIKGFWPKFSLFWRFAASGVRLRREYCSSPESWGDYFAPLIEMCDGQKSPWRGRLGQRKAEFQKICEGGLPSALFNVTAPVVFISGSRDTVFNADRSLVRIREIPMRGELKWEIIPENMHNPTLFWPEKTASVIAKHLT